MSAETTRDVGAELDAMSARVNAVVEAGLDAFDGVAARELLLEAIGLLDAERAWKAALDIDFGDNTRIRAMTIAAEKGSADACFALYTGLSEMTMRLRWLLRAEALGHPQAVAIAEPMRVQGLVGPRQEAPPVESFDDLLADGASGPPAAEDALPR